MHCLHACNVNSLNVLYFVTMFVNYPNLIFLYRCFSHFYSEKILTNHLAHCENFDATRMVFPDNDKIVFDNYQKMVEVPAYIVAGMRKQVHDYIFAVSNYIALLANSFQILNA